MEVHKNDLLTPANAVSTLGFALTAYGAANIDKLSGVAMIGIGRALDLVDGPIARRTHASEFGAAVDGTLDKLGVAAIVVQGLRHDITHDAILWTVAAFNIVNAMATVYMDRKGMQPKSSEDGKHAMFIQNIAIGGFALAYAMGGNRLIEGSSALAFGLSLLPATKASYGYTKQALLARAATRKANKTHKRQKR